MSNIYIQEPPTKGKILIETSVGDVDIELWSREAPKACRNFVQLCMEGYYDGTIFHRVVKGFIVQGGDPTGTGTGGESIYGQPFKDEFHSRLRFVRRGLVAMANAGKDDNSSQFFFTLGSCPELQSKHTIFGKVAGNTLYNMLKLEDSLVDQNDKPLYPNKIISTKVLSNPYNDIVPRVKEIRIASQQATDKQKSKATKNFKLLSFGDEAEEDEEETNNVAKEYRGKSKSSHDLANDPRLSSVPAVDMEVVMKDKETDEHSDDEATKKQKVEDVERVQNKLKVKDPGSGFHSKKKRSNVELGDHSKDGETQEKRKKYEQVQNEIKQIKKELSAKKNVDEGTSERQAVGEGELDPSTVDKVEPQNEVVEEYHNMMKKYIDTKLQQKADKSTKEQKTLEMLKKFQAKLHLARDVTEKAAEVKENEDAESIDNSDDEGWWTHSLCFAANEQKERVAKDANIKNEDTYDISDPRHPINQRRREASKKAMKEKKL